MWHDAPAPTVEALPPSCSRQVSLPRSARTDVEDLGGEEVVSHDGGRSVPTDSPRPADFVAPPAVTAPAVQVSPPEPAPAPVPVAVPPADLPVSQPEPAPAAVARAQVPGAGAAGHTPDTATPATTADPGSPNVDMLYMSPAAAAEREGTPGMQARPAAAPSGPTDVPLLSQSWLQEQYELHSPLDAMEAPIPPALAHHFTPPDDDDMSPTSGARDSPILELKV